MGRSTTHDGLALEPGALRRMALSLGVEADFTEITLLRGGFHCETHAFTLGDRRLVVKRFPPGDCRAAVEFDNLLVTSEVNVPTPERVTLDEKGAWFGTPAFVMTALPGRPDLTTKDVEAWTRSSAIALATIHELDPDLARAPVVPRWRRWQPTTDGLGSDAIRAKKALEALYSVAVDAPVVFSHDDYHPGNVLFCDGSLSGVVDWTDVAVEPRQAAVALYRHMLAIHPGGRAPDLFLAGYEAASGTALDDMPLWDILHGLRGVRRVPHWARAAREFGVQITAQAIRTRSIRWIRRALTLCAE